MKCPMCSRDMKEGVVQSSRTIFFTPKAHKFFMSPDDASGDEITLSQHNWTRPTCKAYHCQKCKKVIIDYDEEV
ncbi:MAG: hypothetical protein IJ325_09725 [Clostridia bacterium]|nr:hypothetical protein [Clostridia bacterium]